MARPYSQISPFTIARGEATAGGGGGASAGTGAFPFSGALVNLTTDETLTTATAVPWDAEVYDVGSWWAIGSPTKLIVPAGVTRVRLTAGLGMSAPASDMQWHMEKNAAKFEGGNWFRQDAGDQAATYVTAIVSVSEGDEFTLVPTFSTGTPKLRSDIVGVAFFAIEAIETSETGLTATVTTTDATQTVLATGAMAADSAHTIRAYGQGREDATGDTYHFEILAGARNEAGTSSAPTPNVIEVADAGGSTWDATLVANDATDQWEIKVTGEAAHTIIWNVTWFEIIKP